MKVLRDSYSFLYIKILLKVSDPVFEKNPTPVKKYKEVFDYFIVYEKYSKELPQTTETIYLMSKHIFLTISGLQSLKMTFSPAVCLLLEHQENDHKWSKSWRKCHVGAFEGSNGEKYMFSH